MGDFAHKITNKTSKGTLFCIYTSNTDSKEKLQKKQLVTTTIGTMHTEPPTMLLVNQDKPHQRHHEK